MAAPNIVSVSSILGTTQVGRPNDYSYNNFSHSSFRQGSEDQYN